MLFSETLASGRLGGSGVSHGTNYSVPSRGYEEEGGDLEAAKSKEAGVL